MSRLAKRGEGKYKADKTLQDAYDLYMEKFNFKSSGSKFSGVNPKDLALSFKEYKKVANKCVDIMIEEVLYHSKTIKLPFKLGDFRIQKKKMNVGLLKEKKNLKIDWGHYQKTGNIIRHLNEDRDFSRYKWFWYCKKGPAGKSFYRFEPLRIRKRELAKIIKTTNIDYFD